MRLAPFVSVAAALAISACTGEPETATGQGAAAGLEGDAALIASVQDVSDALGGCAKPEGGTAVSRVVGLEGSSIVMLACNQTDLSYTYRLFAVRGKDKPDLLSLPDFGPHGWFASTEASMAELDAGTGVLTTFRKGDQDGRCGSEGRYLWNGKTFSLQEMHWLSCKSEALSPPPFPVIWPIPQASPIDQNGATPAP